MPVIIRLFTIIAAFVTGAFLTYLLQFWLLSTDMFTANRNISDRDFLPTPNISTAVKLEATDPELPKLIKPEPESQINNTSETGIADPPAKDESIIISTEKEPTEALAKETTFELISVEPGDSLSKIAIRHYGNQDHANSIFEANRDVLQSPDLLAPGMQLKAPILP